MGFKLTYIFFPALFFLACTTGPDFERTNQHDPGSQNFKPNSAELSNRVISTEKWVTLSWIDKSDFEDGYIIEKRLSKDDNYVTIDTLPANGVSYTDRSRKLTPSSSYKVSPFVYIQTSDSTYINKGDPKVMDLNLKQLGNIELFDRNETIEIEWQNSLEYFDALVFGHRNITMNQNSITWTDTIKVTEISIEELNQNRNKAVRNPLNGFTYEVFVDALLSDPDGGFQSFSKSSDVIRLNKPIFISSGFVDEEKAVFEWKSNVKNVDYYEILEYSRNHPRNTPPNFVDTVTGDMNQYEYHYDRPYVRNNNGIRLGIRAVINENKSQISDQSVTLDIRNLQNFKLTPDDHSLTITWDIPDYLPVPYTKLLVERSINDTESFSMIQELSPDARDFTDTNISSENLYYYRVRSASSDYTPAIGAGVFRGLVSENQFTINENVYFSQLSPDATELGYLIQSVRNTVYFTDFFGNTRTITDPDVRFFSVKFSSDGKHIILTGDVENQARSFVYDRTSLTKKYDFDRENLSERFMLIPETDKILKTRFLTEYDPEQSRNTRKTVMQITDMQSGDVVAQSDKLEGYVLFLVYDNIRNNLIAVSENRNINSLHILDPSDLSVLNSITPANISLSGLYYDENLNTLFYTNIRDLIKFDLNNLTSTKVFSMPRELLPELSSPSLEKILFVEDENLYVFKVGFSGNIYFYDPEQDLISLAYSGLSSDITILDYWKEEQKFILQDFYDDTYFMNIEAKWSVIKSN